MKFFKKGSFAGASLIALAAVSFAACQAKTGKVPPRPAVPVSAAYSEARTIPVQITAIGTGEAYSTV